MSAIVLTYKDFDTGRIQFNTLIGLIQYLVLLYLSLLSTLHFHNNGETILQPSTNKFVNIYL